MFIVVQQMTVCLFVVNSSICCIQYFYPSFCNYVALTSYDESYASDIHVTIQHGGTVLVGGFAKEDKVCAGQMCSSSYGAESHHRRNKNTIKYYMVHIVQKHLQLDLNPACLV